MGLVITWKKLVVKVSFAQWNKNKSQSILKVWNDLLWIIFWKVADIVPETVHSPDVCQLCISAGGRKGKEGGETHLANQREIIKGTTLSSHSSNGLF